MKQFASNDFMNEIINGVKKFQTEVYPEKEALFRSLAKQQTPKILFVTCSDSRIDPTLITQTDPGNLFLIHNAGNIIPPHGSPYGGTGASIEYAVSVLKVEHVIVCGHSSCGAMTALMDDSGQLDLPPVIRHWVSYAEATRAILNAESARLSPEERLSRCIECNVAVQLTHLKTIPSVAAASASGKLALHGWVYNIETGAIDVYDESSERFLPFDQAYRKAPEAVLS